MLEFNSSHCEHHFISVSLKQKYWSRKTCHGAFTKVNTTKPLFFLEVIILKFPFTPSVFQILPGFDVCLDKETSCLPLGEGGYKSSQALLLWVSKELCETATPCYPQKACRKFN